MHWYEKAKDCLISLLPFILVIISVLFSNLIFLTVSLLIFFYYGFWLIKAENDKNKKKIRIDEETFRYLNTLNKKIGYLKIREKEAQSDDAKKFYSLMVDCNEKLLKECFNLKIRTFVSGEFCNCSDDANKTLQKFYDNIEFDELLRKNGSKLTDEQLMEISTYFDYASWIDTTFIGVNALYSYESDDIINFISDK